MDGVSAGASGLAFVGIALQSIKAIYQIISSIKTALQQTTSLASAIKDLEVVLTQFSKCRTSTYPSTNVREITDVVEACKKDVLRYEKVLGGVANRFR
jgi:hypothetical protein